MATCEKRLREAFPDEGPPRNGAFADFTEIEAAGVRAGDATVAEFMEEVIDRSLDLSEFDLPKRCPKCDRTPKHICVPRGIATIRGLVVVAVPDAGVQAADARGGRGHSHRHSRTPVPGRPLGEDVARSPRIGHNAGNQVTHTRAAACPPIRLTDGGPQAENPLGLRVFRERYSRAVEATV